jgi:hypothetical protein
VPAVQQARAIVRFRDDPMDEVLLRKALREFALVVGINCLKLSTCLEKFGNLIGYTCNLLECFFWVMVRMVYDDNKEMVSRPGSIVGVHKPTIHLLSAVASGSHLTTIGAGKQGEVKGLSVRAVDCWSLFVDSNKPFSTVGALFDILLH